MSTAVVLASLASDLGSHTVLAGGVQYKRTVNKGASWGNNVSIWYADGSLVNPSRSMNHDWANGWHARLDCSHTQGGAYNIAYVFTADATLHPSEKRVTDSSRKSRSCMIADRTTETAASPRITTIRLYRPLIGQH